jgi:hypothetical protein
MARRALTYSVPKGPHAGWWDVKMRQSTLFETIAMRLLARQGIAVIWQLHLRASASHRNGNWLSAAALIGIADAAEREWAMRGGSL